MDRQGEKHNNNFQHYISYFLDILVKVIQEKFFKRMKIIHICINTERKTDPDAIQREKI